MSLFQKILAFFVHLIQKLQFIFKKEQDVFNLSTEIRNLQKELKIENDVLGKKSQLTYANLNVIKEYESSNTFKKNFICEHSETKELVLLKQYNKKEQISLFRIINHKLVSNIHTELEVFINHKNPFFVDLLSAYQSQKSLIYITKYIQRENLKQLLQKNIFTENESKFIISNIITCLKLIHEKRFLIIKLEPENIIINDDGYIKLTNLNGCINLDKLNQEIFNLNFNTNYTAPELLYRQFPGPWTDYYSVGLILFELMIRQQAIPIFKDRQSLRDYIQSNQVQIKKRDLPEGWSIESADFINKMIIRKPQNRLGYNGIQEVINHSWFSDISWQKIEDRIQKPYYIPKKKTINLTKQAKFSKCNNFDDVKQKIERNLDQDELFDSYYYNGS